MAPLYKTAAAFCLVGLCWFQSVAAADKTYIFEVAQVEEDAYLTAKLARNGKITAKTNTVEKDDQLVSTLGGKVGKGTEDTQATCSTLMTEELKKLFHYSFEYTGEPDYRTLVQNALKAGLEEFGETYPANAGEWELIWEKEKARSMMHLLGASSTKIGCVIGKCVEKVGTYAKAQPRTTTPAVLFCELSPGATEDQAAFSEEYFNELKERTTQLKDMKEEDLEDPIVTSSANVAVPTILTAGLVAILAAIFA